MHSGKITRTFIIWEKPHIIVVLPNLWQVLDYFDTRLQQHLFGTDARDEEDMRTRNSTTTNDDLAVSLDTIFGGYWRLGHFNADSTGF
jgi:hypothetical protein